MAWAVGCYLVAAALLALAILTYRRTRRRAAEVAKWPRAPAQVIRAQVISRSPVTSWYEPRISYRYVVRGKAYEADRLRLGMRVNYGLRSWARRYLERYSGPVEVYYDPERPEFALLDPTPPSTMIIMCLVFAFLAAVEGSIGLIP